MCMLDIGFLAGIDLFKHLPDSCLEALEKDSNLLDCSAGHLFFQPEQTGRVLFVLETGSVRTFRTYGGRKLTITVLQPPAIFGVMGCFCQGRYLSSAEDLEASRVRMIWVNYDEQASHFLNLRDPDSRNSMERPDCR